MAAGSTYTPIYTTTLGSAQSSLTFNSFSGYTDLIIVTRGTTTVSVSVLGAQYNGDTGANYSKTYLIGDGSTAFTGGNIDETYAICGDAFSSINTNILQIQNYSNSTTYKTCISRSNNSSRTAAWISLWRNTAAITSIVLFPLSGSFDTGSTFTLYGIKAA
jgi:hypothetical protein